MNQRITTLTTRKNETGMTKPVLLLIAVTIIAAGFAYMVFDPFNKTDNSTQETQDPNGNPMMELFDK